MALALKMACSFGLASRDATVMAAISAPHVRRPGFEPVA